MKEWKEIVAKKRFELENSKGQFYESSSESLSSFTDSFEYDYNIEYSVHKEVSSKESSLGSYRNNYIESKNFSIKAPLRRIITRNLENKK